VDRSYDTKKGENMKKTLVVGFALLTSSAFAQSYDSSNSQMNNTDYSAMDSRNREEAGSRMGDNTLQLAEAGSRHMFEFNIDSILAAAISFDKIKTEGQDSDNDTNYDLSLNYFYGVHPNLQVGFRFDYFKGLGAVEDIETLGLDVGGYWNFDEDFSRALFLGGFVGAGWAQQFGNDASRDDLRTASLSVGKRFPLDHWGIKHVTWTPELAMKFINSTTDESIDYQQSLQLRILQFSVLF
jgi:hypothetical protein